MNTASSPYNAESLAVQSHLQILQSIIGRMAANSASCKTWCVTLVSAALILVAERSDSISSAKTVILMNLPITVFAILDSYYLGLERGFRKTYNMFVSKIKSTGSVSQSDIFDLSPSGPETSNFIEGLKSISVWPFYSSLLVVTYVVSIALRDA